MRRYLAFPVGKVENIIDLLKYAINVDEDTDRVVIRENNKRARIYFDGCYEEYEIQDIIDLPDARYYVTGQLVEYVNSFSLVAYVKVDYRNPIESPKL